MKTKPIVVGYMIKFLWPTYKKVNIQLSQQY